MISVNDINPQMVQNLLDRVELLEKMIYDYDGKGIRQKTINGDRITGGIIEGTLLQTTNTTTYVKVHEQYVEFYYQDKLLMVIGYYGDGVFPSVEFHNNSGETTGMITVDNTDTVLYIGSSKFTNPVTFEQGAFTGDGQQLATMAWVATNFVPKTQ